MSLRRRAVYSLSTHANHGTTSCGDAGIAGALPDRYKANGPHGGGPFDSILLEVPQLML